MHFAALLLIGLMNNLFTKTYPPMHPPNKLTTLCLLLCLVKLTQSLSANSTTAPNSLYSNAGVGTFDTTPYFGTSTTTLNPALFTITFVRTQTTTTYRFGCSINSINYQITNNKLNYTVLPSATKTSSSVQLAFYTNNANKINLLKVGYMTIQPLFGSYYFSYRMLMSNRNFKQTTASSYTQVSSSDGPFNTSLSYNLWITILGVDASMAANNQIDLYPSASVTGSTNITYVIQTISPTQFYMSSIVIMAFIYNTAQLQALSRSATLTMGTFDNTYTSSLSATDASNSVRSFNTLVGIVGFHIANLNYSHFTATITPNNSLSFSSNYSYNYVKFNYLIATFIYCAPSTPFLVASTKICYDICPIRYSTDNQYFECNACPTYDCYYCASNGLCTQCSSSVDFRELNTSTNRCVPLDGYYDNGTSQAVPCNSTLCLTCSSATVCLSCQTGKYLSSTTCLSCISNCYSCSNGSSCSQCNTGYTYSSSNNSCFLNCSTITNCLTCSYSSALTCNSCVNGHQLNSNACQSVCGDGNRASNQLCDDGNTINNDGCSSTCTIQLHFFCVDTNSGSNVLSACDACSPNCDKCVNASFCSNCSANYSQNISGNTAACVQSCILHCSTCNGSLCTACNPGFSLITSTLCQPVCGDGYVYSSESCDDGNKDNGDGCSSVCQVEQNFNCTTNSNNTSVCSLLSLSITVQSITKDQFTNTVFLSYHFSQTNYNTFKSLNWPTILSQQTNLSFTLSSFSYDSTTSNLIVAVQYQSILSSRTVSFKFAFPNSPPFDRIGNITVAAEMSASNNLSLWAYDNADYYMAYILHYVILAMTILALLFFVMGYYAGKLIALQLISILQLAYYCLIYTQNMAPGFVALKQMGYSNGYKYNIFGQSSAVANPKFVFLGYDHILLNNFNINLAVVLVPLLLAVVLGVYSLCKSNKSNSTNKTTTWHSFCGQFVFYGLLFMQYSLLMPLLTIGRDIAQLSLIQIGHLQSGILFLLILIIYNCLLNKFPKYFGQFTSSFQNTKTINYYIFIQLDKLITACLLVFLSSWKYQMFTIIAMLILKLVILIRKKPYRSQGGNFRPFLNIINQLCICSLFCLYNFIGNTTFEFHYFAPFFITGHIFVAIVYNLYFLFKCIKKRCRQSRHSSKVSDMEVIEDRNPWKQVWQYSKQSHLA